MTTTKSDEIISCFHAWPLLKFNLTSFKKGSLRREGSSQQEGQLPLLASPVDHFHAVKLDCDLRLRPCPSLLSPLRQVDLPLQQQHPVAATPVVYGGSLDNHRVDRRNRIQMLQTDIQHAHRVHHPPPSVLLLPSPCHQPARAGQALEPQGRDRDQLVVLALAATRRCVPRPLHFQAHLQVSNRGGEVESLTSQLLQLLPLPLVAPTDQLTPQLHQLLTRALEEEAQRRMEQQEPPEAED
eukprot:752752-Hanusia_phi.AAC.6